jgi:uncharacterized protein
MVLIPMALAEAKQSSAIMLDAAGIPLLYGHLMHAFGLKADTPKHPLPIAGNTGAMLAVVLPVVVLARALTGL